MGKRKDFSQSITQALRDSSFSMMKTNGQVVLGITEEYDLADKLKRIEYLVKRIGKSEGDLFWVKIGIHGRPYMAKNRLGDNFYSESKYLVLLKEHYPFHQFAPHVDVFVRHVEEMKVGDICLDGFLFDEVKEGIHLFNECVRRIRSEVNSKDFADEVSKNLRRVNKNFKELNDYIKALFRNCARLVVLRIDLAYLNKYGENALKDTAITYDDVKKHREQWLRDLREKLLPESMVGYAWKLEYGLEKNYHYHVMVFLDGSKVRQDVTIAMLIGEHWMNKVTGGKGLYYNCNANKEGYRYCGIGVVNHDDEEKRMSLMRAAMYLTKLDYYIKLVASDSGKTFSKGNWPKPTCLGRPRKKTVKGVISNTT
ncbi:MAG: inovirus-type Gp2 protein [Agitococcus sp.]|nr:inovirus-type Gp2 protein [Agitococcus sp.]